HVRVRALGPRTARTVPGARSAGHQTALLPPRPLGRRLPVRLRGRLAARDGPRTAATRRVGIVAVPDVPDRAGTQHTDRRGPRGPTRLMADRLRVGAREKRTVLGPARGRGAAGGGGEPARRPGASR